MPLHTRYTSDMPSASAQLREGDGRQLKELRESSSESSYAIIDHAWIISPCRNDRRRRNTSPTSAVMVLSNSEIEISKK
uniref:Uncharacterized protein n=1 Tax=Plectus sambesii TaxID=2011161 RepID=A0A914W881_9BILA